MRDKETSVFETLNAVNVNENKKKKNNLDYLSWAWAWAELHKLYPDATSKVYETDQGINYWNDGKTAWVKVGVTVDGLEHIEYLPIMDFKNKSIPINNVTSTDVNKAIQRGLTKAIARHGLGLYIYAGEDIPEEETPQPPKLYVVGKDKKEFDEQKLQVLVNKMVSIAGKQYGATLDEQKNWLKIPLDEAYNAIESFVDDKKEAEIEASKDSMMQDSLPNQ
ncbi:Sak single strand annealing protein [Lactococcus taiwanensis]|uniref:Sak single strand annealing protein n=1 Tax=Lactococcus taiwanensis TaxID=1151742 RepID=UPI003511818D